MHGRRTLGTVMPPIWVLLMDLWDIPEPCRSLWWQALAATRWTENSAWRRRLVLAETLGDPSTMTDRVWTPPQCIHSLELLVSEGLLAPPQANQIMTMVLAKCDARGDWK